MALGESIQPGNYQTGNVGAMPTNPRQPGLPQMAAIEEISP